MDALYGFQDLAPKTQGGADAESSSGHTPPQVCQVSALEDQVQGESVFQNSSVYLGHCDSVFAIMAYWVLQAGAGCSYLN